jgi:ABC-type uncharacterized transport system auxiliary subunit
MKTLWMWSNNVTMYFSKTNVISLLFMTLLLNACGGLTKSDKAPVISWWLEPFTAPAMETGSEPSVSVNVVVKVVPGLDTDQILALSEAAAIKPYSSARWVDNLPDLLDSLVSRTLTASGRFDLGPGHGGNQTVNCDLQLEFTEFFGLLNASAQTTEVRVVIEGRYQCDSGISLPLNLRASIPLQDKRMSVIVAAFQQATDAVLKDMLDQL